MKILGLYKQETLSLMRRVRAPFSVLASRNQSFNLVQTEAFTNGITFSADVTVLSNWELSESELDALQTATRQRSIVIDCSDPGLIDNDLYREQLAMASLVTVPNDWMRFAIRAINPNVWVIPSCVDLPHFMAANQVKLATIRPWVIGCLGPYDWYLVRDALVDISQRHEKLMVCAGPEASLVLRNAGIRGIEPEITVYNLPEIIRNCHFGLCPRDGERGYDTVWQHEYGALCRPVIAPISKQDTTFWVKSIEEMLSNRALRAKLARQAFDTANENRATKIADRYISTYRKRLPHLLFS